MTHPYRIIPATTSFTNPPPCKIHTGVDYDPPEFPCEIHNYIGVDYDPPAIIGVDYDPPGVDFDPPLAKFTR